MDLILIACIAIYGCLRVNTDKQACSNKDSRQSGIATSVIDIIGIPVGNNLELIRELGAFTKIIKELGLK